MAWSDVPRSKKVLILGTSVLVLSVGLAIIGTGGSKTPSADNSASNPLLDSGLDPDAINVLIETITDDDKVASAFLDAIADKNLNCKIDPTESDGYASQTEADGTATMSLPAGSYVLRGTDISSNAEGTTAIAVGAVSGASCTKQISVANTDPVIIRLISSQ